MSKTLMDLQSGSMNFRNSKTAIKRRNQAEKVNQFLENRKYEGMLNEEAMYDARKEIVSKRASNMTPHSRRAMRGKALRESFKFKGEMKINLFTEGLVDMCFNSLILDESFKTENKDDIKGYYRNQIKTLMENGDLDIKGSANVIQELYKICEETADVAKDVVLKATQDSIKDKSILNEKDPKMSEDVETDVKNDDNKTMDNAAIGTPNGSKSYVEIPDYVEGDYKLYVNDVMKDVYSVIKDKVVDVIRNEKDNEDIEKDLRQEILFRTNNSQATADNTNYEAQNKLDTDSGSIADVELAKKGDTRTASEIADGPMPKMSESYSFARKAKRNASVPSLFQSIVINTGRNFLNENTKLIQEGKADFDFNMDLIMAESIVIYTLIESLNTTKLYSMDPLTARKKVIDFMMK